METATIEVLLEGVIHKSDQDAYADAHDADEGVVGAGGGYLPIESSKDGDNKYDVVRGYLSFDTSFLGATTSIIGAILCLVGGYGSSVEADVGQATLHVVRSVHGSELISADFGGLKTKMISGGSISVDDWQDTYEWNEILLNTTGNGWVSKTGITKFGLRLAGDIDNNTPTGLNRIFNFLGTYDSILVIGYEAVSGSRIVIPRRKMPRGMVVSGGAAIIEGVSRTNIIGRSRS